MQPAVIQYFLEAACSSYMFFAILEASRCKGKKNPSYRCWILWHAKSSMLARNL